MTQLMRRWAAPIFITSMLVSAPATAGAVTSNNSYHGAVGTQVSAQPRRPVFTFQITPSDLLTQPSRRTGRQACVTRRCKRREWRKHHPLPKYPRRKDEASWYPPGGPLGCPEYGDYVASDMGVANKELPCGTQLRLCYIPDEEQPRHPAGHCVQVTVMDRGPYVAGRVFDLQQAPKERLGFPDLGKVHWTVISSRSKHRS
jgi:rare lipoprotein A (peptidoglycan hydrolase)